MNHHFENGTLTFYPTGDISSSNAAQIEAEVFQVFANSMPTKVVLDISGVHYVSSAGLRVVLKLLQRCKDTSVINASPDVYEVFEMTGFTRMMTVEKRLVEIDVSGAVLIGQGYFSEVYRIDKDTIIKVFRQRTTIEDVRRELNLAKQAFVLGIPTAISFDVVTVGNRFGVRFEMLDCASLRDVFRDEPDRYDEMINKYATLLRTINTTTPSDPTLPSTKAEWLRKVDGIKEFLSKEKFAKLHRLIESIEDRDTFVHGDCHFKNIMVQNDDLLLIDMDTLSYGHPIFELAAIHAPYVAFEEDDPGNCERFLGLPASFVQPMFRKLLDVYLGGLTEQTFQKIALVSYAHMLWWNKVNDPENKARHEGNLGRLNHLLDIIDDLDIGI